MVMIHLVIGGARSGKSSFAEQQVLIQSQTKQLVPSYIATATAGDGEMTTRIAKHQQQRDMQLWQLNECPLKLTQLINNLDEKHYYLLDCLTLWLTNVLMAAFDCHSVDGEPTDKQVNNEISDDIARQVDELLNALRQSKVDIVIVTNEVGQGIVPLGALSRLFVDHAGWLNQKVAAVADRVTLVTAGLPLTLKPAATTAKLAGGNIG